MPPVVSIVSKSKSVKTTVIERLAQEFGDAFSLTMPAHAFK
jgi:molybdopterin-guanine dinucleotide biosynthesis protein